MPFVRTQRRETDPGNSSRNWENYDWLADTCYVPAIILRALPMVTYLILTRSRGVSLSLWHR